MGAGRLRVLFLNESSLPRPYTTSAITGREMRLVRDLGSVERVIALGRGGADYVDAGGGEPELGIEVRHYPLLDSGKRGPLFYPLALWSALRLLRSAQVDIIHAESPVWSGVVAALLGLAKKKPVIVEVRYSLAAVLGLHYRWLPLSLRRFLVNRVTRWVVGRAAAVITNSRRYRDEVIALGVDAERVVVVSPGLALTPELRVRIEAARGLREPRFTVCFLGRLEPGKAPSHVLRAVDRAQKEAGPIRLIVAGRGSELPALRRLADELELDVEFPGQVSAWDWLPRAQVLVNPSLEAPALDVVNLEAYVAGLPVIAYGRDGLPETVLDQRTGIIVEPGDWEGLARAIVDLSRDAPRRDAYAAAGQALVERDYAYERQVEAMGKAYGLAVSERGGG